MSRRAQRAAFAACAGVLSIAGAILVALGPSEAMPPAEMSQQATGRPSFAELERRSGRRAERLAPQILRSGVAAREAEPPEPALYGRTRRVAEPVARRFFAAYSRYEVGRLGAGVRRILLATTAGSFGAELLAAPPRVPGGARRPARAELGPLQLVPAAEEIAQGKLGSIELVGEVRRAHAGSELLAIAMELEDGRWAVGGLGR